MGPMCFNRPRRERTSALVARYVLELRNLVRCRESAPTLRAIDISLSLSIIVMCVRVVPKSLSAS